jgi:hypothetical protein
MGLSVRDRGWFARVSRMLTVVTVGATLVACGAAAQSKSTSPEERSDATATYVVVLTQVAEAKVFVATATAEARLHAPTATSVPTSTPMHVAEPTPTPNTFTDVTPSPNFEGDILSVLPTTDLLPEGFSVAVEGPLTAEDVASQYVDQAGFMAKLANWGFRQGGARAVIIARASPDDQKKKMTTFNSAVIEFGSPEQTKDSITQNREYVKKAIVGDPPNLTLEGLGDYAIAVQGSVRNGGNMEHWAFIWVQKGNLAYFFRGMSLGKEPMDAVTQIAMATLAK